MRSHGQPDKTDTRDILPAAIGLLIQPIFGPPFGNHEKLHVTNKDFVQTLPKKIHVFLFGFHLKIFKLCVFYTWPMIAETFFASRLPKECATTWSVAQGTCREW